MARTKRSYKKRVTKKRLYKNTARTARITTTRRTIKQMVKGEIARNIEDKEQQVYDLGFDIVPSASASFDSKVLPMGPDATGLIISQGSGQGQRVGNKIRLKRLVFKGVIHPKGYDAATNPTPCPCQVKMWFFYDREEPNGTPTPKTNGDFFQFGNSTSGFQNDLTDMVSPVNTDRYRILATRVFKIGYQQYTGTGAQAGQGNFSNNDFRLNRQFSVNLTKLHPKIVQYRDTATGPTNRNVYMMAQAVYANGEQMGATTVPLRMSYIQDFKYEDA